MTRPSRTRRILKWTGAGLSLLIVIAWIVSLWFQLSHKLTPDAAFVVDEGYLSIAYFEGDVTAVLEHPIGITGHGYLRAGLTWPRIGKDWVISSSYYGGIWIGLPLWLLLLLTAIPTAWLWHRDRRRVRPGCCLRCGYDLTGNTSGVCSECGLPATPAPEKPRRLT